MLSKAKLLLPVLMLLTASCAASQTHPVTPTLPSGSNSQTTSATERFTPCSSLVLGQVSTKDTTETLGWLLPLMAAIKRSCALPAQQTSR